MAVGKSILQGGLIATLGASDVKHNKMIVVWLKSE